MLRQPKLPISIADTYSPDSIATERNDTVPSVTQSTNEAETLTAEVPVAAEKTAQIEDVRTPKPKSSEIKNVEIKLLTQNHPFKAEALKILSGKLTDVDSISRHSILNYCEHLRTAYTTRDIDFIRQVFSDDALIIVGHVVKSYPGKAGSLALSDKVTYSVRSKQEYVKRLAQIFDSGKEIDVEFSDFSIMSHPTMPGIYGVTLRQNYQAGNYNDDGYLFLLWDFRNMSMPLIHVRTWQPSGSPDDVIDLSDFNLE